jgi:hypothetical protein
MYSGVIYDAAHPPSDPKYVLQNADLHSLAGQLVGTPIRIEHTTADTAGELRGLQNVGRVTAARLDGGGSLYVDWSLDDTPVGWSSARFIETGVAPELSLQHALYSDGSVKPIEVSIVRKGARAGCSIMASSYKASEPTEAIMSSTPAAAVPEPAAAPAPAAVDVPARAVEEAAPPAAEGEPSAKRKRYDTPMDFVNDISTKVPDTATLQSILDYFAENMDTHLKTQQEVTSLRQAKELLEQSQKAHVESSKNVVRDIVDALSAMYQNFGAITMDTSHKDKLASLLSENVDAREALRPILVAASAISTLREAARTASSNAAVQAAAQKISELSGQLTAARRLTNAPAAAATSNTVAPMWTNAAAAVPVVEVAASAHAAAPAAPAFHVPDILRGGPTFSEGGVGRVTKDLFTRKV